MPLKSFHNRIKAGLIRRFVTGTDTLLDLCCGRGGDLWKWADAGVRFVRGIDLSPREVEEARQRLIEMNTKRAAEGTSTDLMAEFETTDQLGMSQYMHANVSCLRSLRAFLPLSFPYPNLPQLPPLFLRLRLPSLLRSIAMRWARSTA